MERFTYKRIIKEQDFCRGLLLENSAHETKFILNKRSYVKQHVRIRDVIFKTYHNEKKRPILHTARIT
jgi:hypothetical protein